MRLDSKTLALMIKLRLILGGKILIYPRSDHILRSPTQTELIDIHCTIERNLVSNIPQKLV